jgi:hypothetical protein
MANKPAENAAGQGNAPASLEAVFKLFAVEQRVLAQNGDGKLIDIGAIESTATNQFVVQMDLDGIESKAWPNERAALEDIAAKLSFDYLDGLFTSEAEAEFHGNLQEYPHARILLDETFPSGLTDRTPPHLF